MTDDEREAQIRQDWNDGSELNNIGFLLRSLNEARAGIARLREALAAHQDELGITGLSEQLAGAKAEIARLTDALAEKERITALARDLVAAGEIERTMLIRLTPTPTSA